MRGLPISTRAMIPKRSLFQLAAALEGLAIVGVLPGTPSSRAGIRYGDVLLDVNGQRVKTFDDYIAAKALRADGMDVIVFRSGTEQLEKLAYDSPGKATDLATLVAQLAEARLGVADSGEPHEESKPS